jgi:hypothetical protein
MHRFKVINYSTIYLVVALLVSSATAFSAQKVVKSSNQSAGFSFSMDSATTEPVIQYQQNIQMLSSVDDKFTLTIFGDGRVVVHYPVYMKKAGDYEMHLDMAELENLIQSFSTNGLMNFDEKKARQSVTSHEKALAAQGQFYTISDATETVIDITLDSYQENKRSTEVNNFNKRFKWKNLEHDARRYKNNSAIVKANSSVSQLKALMNDSRLVKVVPQGAQQ